MASYFLFRGVLRKSKKVFRISGLNPFTISKFSFKTEQCFLLQSVVNKKLESFTSGKQYPDFFEELNFSLKIIVGCVSRIL